MAAEVTLEDAHEDCDFDTLRKCAEEIEGAVSSAESCETISDYRANLEELIDSAELAIREAKEALSGLAAREAKAKRRGLKK